MQMMACFGQRNEQDGAQTHTYRELTLRHEFYIQGQPLYGVSGTQRGSREAFSTTSVRPGVGTWMILSRMECSEASFRFLFYFSSKSCHPISTVRFKLSVESSLRTSGEAVRRYSSMQDSECCRAAWLMKSEPTGREGRLGVT